MTQPNPGSDAAVALGCTCPVLYPLGDDVDIELLARGTPGFAGADLENLANEAALFAARRAGMDKSRIGMKESSILGARIRPQPLPHASCEARYSLGETPWNALNWREKWNWSW